MANVDGVYGLDGERVVLRGLVALLSDCEAERLCEIEPELARRMPRENIGDKTPHEAALFRLLREFAGWLEDECSERAERDHEKAWASQRWSGQTRPSPRLDE